MGKKNKPYASYQAMPPRSRFWVYSEACYTETELELREWVLKARANSGIHPDYLVNPGSWFSSDDQQAFINVYEHSWFFSKALKTRQTLTRDDFLVQPIDNQRLQWPQLYELMQRVGDYLVLRNQNLPLEHLNQPMNFIMLDINNMLKGLSQNANIAQTQNQLEHVLHYIRAIEKNTSPLIGSDRLFLANLRSVIDGEIRPYLTHLTESQLLKDRLVELSKITQQLAEERHRELHFALNANAVNPHPRDFTKGELNNVKAYPTLAVKECAQSTSLAVVPNMSTLKLSKEVLRDCAHFKLITSNEEILQLYANAVMDLNELTQFQKIITQTIDLLEQAGEVYTVYQFKEQLIVLLNQLDHFVDTTFQTMETLIHENTQAYHKAIQDEQNLSFFQKWFTSEKEQLDAYIKNQDMLAQFPSTTSELAKTNLSLKNSVAQIMAHLNQPARKKTNFAAIAAQTQELNTLMGSMHEWVKIQYEAKGLAPPQQPEKLQVQLNSCLISIKNPLPTAVVSNTIRSLDVHFFAKNTPINNATSSICSSDQPQCALPRYQVQAANASLSVYWLGLATLLPIGVILLYLFLKSQEQSEKIILGTKEEFAELCEQVDDLLAQINEVPESDDDYVELEYEDFVAAYNALCRKARLGRYEVTTLQALYEDMNSYYEDYINPKYYDNNRVL